MKITNINKIIQDSDDNENEYTDSDIENMTLDDLQNNIFDLSLSISIRKKCIESFHIKTDKNEYILEIINKLAGMYIFSGTKLLEEYINELCLNSNLSINYKYILIDALSTPIYSLDSNMPKISKYAFTTLNKLCENLEGLSTPIKILMIKTLMKSDNYYDESIKYFSKIINDNNIDCDFRYKSILSLENDNLNKYMKDLLFIFFKSENDSLIFIRYKILCGQCILQKKLYNSFNEFIFICDTLLNFCKNDLLEYNARADSCDVILRMENIIIDDYKSTYTNYLKEARNTINLLGHNDLNPKTIYDNAQNVHVIELEESVIRGIEFLNEFKIKQDITINYKYIKDKLDIILEKKYDKELDKDKLKQIYTSLNRIYIDRALYSKYNSTLLSIFIKLWNYIESNSNSDELIQILIDELYDMAETCSTGYAGRLVNVLSGQGEFNFTISWEDQIMANFTGRMNARIREIPIEWNTTKRLSMIIENLLKNKFDIKFNLIYNYVISYNDNRIEKFIKDFNFLIDRDYNQYMRLFLKNVKEYDLYPHNEKLYELYRDSKNNMDEILLEFQDEVLNQVDNKSSKDRDSFLLFAREIFLSITEELYHEFKDYISDSDYNLYIRKAIINYEGNY